MVHDPLRPPRDRTTIERRGGPLAWPVLALVVVTAIAYGSIGELGFISFDDPQYVAKNALVLRGFSFDGLRYAFTTTDMGNWHPLTWLSHMSVAQFFGANAAAHHV